MTRTNENASSLIMLFGATGDLAKRKLFPAIFNLYKKNKLGKQFAVIGTARSNWNHELLRDHVKQSLISFTKEPNELEIEEFITHFYYQTHDVTNSESYIELKKLADTLDEEYSLQGNRLFYLSMAPEFFGTIAEHLKADGLKTESGFNRLVIEKPFGHDLESAKLLNEQISQAFNEDEVYRIDHYLGKAMVQNIITTRFGNTLFEPIWNAKYISNIQVTASEILGVEDRAGYYEHSGALRDMIQNHLFQMVALLAMDKPKELSAEAIRTEKANVFRSMRSIENEEVDNYFVRGQYGAGAIEGRDVIDYRDENNVQPGSITETYVAGKVMIDNERWNGVPIYVRTGKRLASKATKIVVEFKNLPTNIYSGQSEDLNSNLLVFHIQPTEGVSLLLNAKKSGIISETTPVQLNFNAEQKEGFETPEAYEKMFDDCLHGDATNFTHWDDVSLSWAFVDKISEHWSRSEANFPNYESGSAGPKAADALLEKEGHTWWKVEDLILE